MKTTHRWLISGALALLAAAWGPMASAATGAQAGTTVNNTASVAYAVGGVAQTPVSSNIASFVVDRKVNLTVAEVGGTATQVGFGQTDQVTTFTVTNTTNAVQDFRLYAINTAFGFTTQLGRSDNFNVNNLRVFVDANANGLYDAGVDTATYIDELAPEGSKTVFIVADVPATGPAGGVAGVELNAVAAAGGAPGALGADLVQSLLDNPGQVDTVFADGAGYGDLARDGRFSASDEYDIAVPTAQVTKTALVISDPMNGVLAPKAIPGAVVEYCIQVKNIGSLPLTSVAVTDAIPADTTYQASSTYVGGNVLLGACLFDGAQATDANVFNGARVAANIASLAVGVTTTVRFRVTVN